MPFHHPDDENSLADLRSSLNLFVHCSDQEFGLDRPSKVALAFCAPMRDALRKNDLPGFADIFEKCVKTADGPELRAPDFRLRCQPQIFGQQIDPLVCAQIGLAVITWLVGSEPEAIFDLVFEIANLRAYPAYGDISYIMSLQLIRMQIERSNFDAAIRIAQRNRAVAYWCPHSGHYLFLAQQRKQTENPTKKQGDAPDFDLAERFCEQPFTNLATTGGGGRYELEAAPKIFACGWSSFLPFCVSDGSANQAPDQIWNGETIREIRGSILAGEFTYCAKSLCPRIVNKQLPKRKSVSDPGLRKIIDNGLTRLDTPPRVFNLAHDASCNLACPSCRREIFAAGSARRNVLSQFTNKVLLPLMADARAILVLAGDGDPFASKHYREIVHNFDPSRHADVRIMFATNGLLLTRREWEDLAAVHRQIEAITVSIDAATATTYEELRQPGKWSTLVENMEFLSELAKSAGGPRLGIRFVVQKRNFREIPDFVRLGQQWGVSKIRFQRLLNLGAFSPATLKEIDVCDPAHSEHGAFLTTLRDPVMQSPEIDPYTIHPFVLAANAP